MEDLITNFYKKIGELVDQAKSLEDSIDWNSLKRDQKILTRNIFKYIRYPIREL